MGPPPEIKAPISSPTPPDDPVATLKTPFSKRIDAGRFDVSDVLYPLIRDFKKNNLK
jgi:hypothetical protein